MLNSYFLHKSFYIWKTPLTEYLCSRTGRCKGLNNHAMNLTAWYFISLLFVHLFFFILRRLYNTNSQPFLFKPDFVNMKLFRV